jgi:nicotinamidase/pyrazinamidase
MNLPDDQEMVFSMKSRTCLIITDVQNDFCPGGALAIPEGDQIIPVINNISSKFDKVVATQDWHHPGHISFASSHGKKPYDVISIRGMPQVVWPDHCVPGTFGAEFHKDLDLTCVDLIIRKGSSPTIDSYSTFVENDKATKTGLQYYLQGLDIRNLFICGLATDYCVYYSALDAVALGFHVTVIIDACRGVDVPPGNVDHVLAAMRRENIQIETHTRLPVDSTIAQKNFPIP